MVRVNLQGFPLKKTIFRVPYFLGVPIFGVSLISVCHTKKVVMSIKQGDGARKCASSFRLINSSSLSSSLSSGARRKPLNKRLLGPPDVRQNTYNLAPNTYQNTYPKHLLFLHTRASHAEAAKRRSVPASSRACLGARRGDMWLFRSSRLSMLRCSPFTYTS